MKTHVVHHPLWNNLEKCVSLASNFMEHLFQHSMAVGNRYIDALCSFFLFCFCLWICYIYVL